MDENLVWKPVEVEKLVDDEWMQFRKVAYAFPDGTVFSPYYNYSRRHYVVILASDATGRFLCVRQYRHGIAQVTTEFPAGGIEGGLSGAGRPLPPLEVALQTAKRELREETGYESDDWEHLITIPSNPTLADNYAYCFRAKNCRLVTGQHLDDTEFLRFERLTPEEIDGLIAQEKFQQAIHVMAWLLAKGGRG